MSHFGTVPRAPITTGRMAVLHDGFFLPQDPDISQLSFPLFRLHCRPFHVMRAIARAHAGTHLNLFRCAVHSTPGM